MKKLLGQIMFLAMGTLTVNGCKMNSLPEGDKNGVFEPYINAISNQSARCKNLRISLIELCKSEVLSECTVEIDKVNQILEYEQSLPDLTPIVHEAQEAFKNATPTANDIHGNFNFWGKLGGCITAKYNLWLIIFNSVKSKEITPGMKVQILASFKKYLSMNQKDVNLVQTAIVIAVAKVFAETGLLSDAPGLREQAGDLKQQFKDSPAVKEVSDHKIFDKLSLKGKIKSFLHMDLVDGDYDIDTVNAKQTLLREYELAEQFAAQLNELLIDKL